MSTKALQKIDKFFPIYIVTLLLLAGLVILTFNGIFSAVTKGFEADDGGNPALIINKSNLDSALDAALNRENIQLTVTDQSIPLEEEE